jgi:ATP-binding cassette subfamily B protein
MSPKKKKHRRSLRQTVHGLRRVLGHFAPYVRQQRALIAASFVALVAEVVLRALEPWPLKLVFDRVLGSKRHRHVGPAFLDGYGPEAVVAVAAGAVIALSGLRALAAYANTIGFAKTANRVLGEVRARAYRHLQGLSLSFHTQARGGDLVLRVLSDVSMLRDVTVTAALPLLANALVLAGMVVMMFVVDARLALVALAALPLVGLTTARLTPRIQQAAKEQRKREAAMAAGAAETVGAIKVVQALGLEGPFADAFLRRNREGQREDVRGARLTASLDRSVAFLIAASTAVVLWVGARRVLAGELSPGGLVVFLAYLKNAFRPLQDLAKHTGRLAKASAAGERVVDLLEQVPEVRDLPGAAPAPPLRGQVRLEAITFAYEPGRRALDRLDFEVPAGAHVAVVGPSGAGKSTLANLLLRLYDPTQGRVLVDGRDVREYTLASLRAQVGVVLQEAVLFAASVRDNIALGAPGATPEAVEEAARLANAHEFIAALPLGYDTVLGERGVTLSGGQRQRIAIARAAVRRAPVLVLDEPAAGLDEENEREVLGALARLARGRTTFLITHDLRTASGSDVILYLERGRLLERGTHAELLRAGGRYAALYRLQTAAGEPTARRAGAALVP